MESHSVVCRFVVACCMVGPLLPARAQVEDPNHVVVTVVDRQGVPLAGVQVTECTAAREFTTDANGQFTCESSQQVRYFYAVDKQRTLAESERLDAGARRLEIKLAPARIVSGRVTDPNGRPASGVQIAALPMTSAYVLTDGQGQYDVGWLPSWEHPDGLCLMARHIERNLAALVDISRRAIRVDIQLAPALAISGTVTDARAAALSGATVSVELCKWSWACGTPVPDAVTDRTGGFTLSALPQLQEYRLRVAAAGYPIRRLAMGVIYTVKDREEMDPISLTAPRAPARDTDEFGRLLIRVLDEDRKPVDVTSMQLWTPQDGGGTAASSLLLLSTPEPGLYEVDQIPVGSCDRLSIYAENLAPLSLTDVEVRKGRPEVIECFLSRGGTIQGVVTDEKGKPIMGLPVVVNSILCRRDVKTDPNGHFIASHLPDTRYSVSVEPDSESPYATTVLTGGTSCNAEGLRIVVKQKTEVKAPAFGVGASIWQLGKASLPVERSQCEGKAILLCLFDRDQRASRNCLRQLVAQAKDLDGEGVVVAAVQTTSMDRGEVDEWAEENDVTVPLGVLQSSQNGEQAVAIDSLPWLILTDRMHIIRAEGFGIDELATRVKEITDGEQ